MKKIIVPAVLILLIANSCVKNKTLKAGSAKVVFENMVDNNPVNMDGVLRYTNAFGNKYSVTLLEYYISGAVLVSDKNDSVSLGNYTLINEARSDKKSFSFGSVPAANYTKLVFNLGIPYDRNHTGLQDGDLDPAMGMIWDWNTGYIFMKHEGKFTDSIGVDQSLLFHYGTDKAFISWITIPITMTIRGNTPTIYVKFDLNKVYVPSLMNFNIDNNHQSALASDEKWIGQMGNGLETAFSLDKVQ